MQRVMDGRRMKRMHSRQTFSHDVIEELHDGNPPIGVTVEQLAIHPGCEELSAGGNKKRWVDTYKEK